MSVFPAVGNKISVKNAFFHVILNYLLVIEVKQSRYRPGVAQRVPES